MSSNEDLRESRILIVGCGTWGASTALHLARRGYKNVTVLDPYQLPSEISAGNDINKIVSCFSPLDLHVWLTRGSRKGIPTTNLREAAMMKHM